MSEILRDPAVQSILAIVAVIVPVVIYWKQRKRKSLGYEVLYKDRNHLAEKDV